MREIKDLMTFKHDLVRSETLTEIEHNGSSYPINVFHIGSQDPTTPVFFMTGGVHGLEKIGTHVINTYLHHLFNQLKWDKTLVKQLENSRIIAMPIVNPVGMSHNTRSNGNGVDLMRNAPIESSEEFNLPLVSGHQVSPTLPWFRGNPKKMELESEALVNFARKYLFETSVSLALDLHSGFGLKDRLWYPYASSSKRYPLYRETQNIIQLFEESYPHHIYIIEQQSDSYTVHGDLWDYMFLEHFEKNEDKQKMFIPLCLEMGSWSWLRKNPKQLFNILGLYNPIVKHRYNRVMRRHLHLLTFLSHIVCNREAWE